MVAGAVCSLLNGFSITSVNLVFDEGVLVRSATLDPKTPEISCRMVHNDWRWLGSRSLWARHSDNVCWLTESGEVEVCTLCWFNSWTLSMAPT